MVQADLRVKEAGMENPDDLEIELKTIELRADLDELKKAIDGFFGVLNAGLDRLNATIEKGLEAIEKAKGKNR